MKVIRQDLPEGLTSNYPSAWEDVEWPKTANTLLAVFEPDGNYEGYIVLIGYDIYGWMAGTKQGWCVSETLRHYQLPTGLYFWKSKDNRPERVAVEIAKRIIGE